MKPDYEIRFLIVEDDRESSEALARLLQKKFNASVDIVNGIGPARKILESGAYDIVTVDLVLPDGDGLDLVAEITAEEHHPQVIMITGHGDEEIAARAFRVNVADYVVKDKRLGPNLVEAVRRTISGAQLREARRELEQERAFFETAMDTLPDAFVVFDLEHNPVRWNSALCEISGFSPEEVGGMHATDFFVAEDSEHVLRALFMVAESGEKRFVDARLRAKDGSTIPLRFSAGRLVDERGDPVGVVGVGRDISGQKRSEESMRRIITETNKRREEVTALLESTRYVLDETEFEPAASSMLTLIMNLTGADAGFVALLEGEGGKARIVIVRPPDLGNLTEGPIEMPVGELQSRPFTSGKAIYENDFASSPMAEVLPARHIDIRCALFAPLLVEGKPAGLITLANKPGGFDNRDSLMTSAFGEILSVALRNSRVLEALRRRESAYRGVVEDQAELICRFDPDGTLNFVNEAYCRFFGKSRDELVGSSLYLLVGEGEEEHLRERLASLGYENPTITNEHTVFDRSGEVRWQQWNNRAIFDEKGNLVEVQGVGRDITERVRAEQALEESVRRFEDVADNVAEWIWEVDAEGIYRYSSPAVAEVLGHQPEDVLGKHFFDFFHPEDAEELRKAAFDVFENKESFRDFVNRNLDADGEEVWLSTSGVPVMDEEGNLLGYRGADFDVTARRRRENELKKLNAELESYARAVSHDLKGPLSSIMAAVVTLQQLAEDPAESVREIREMARIIDENVRNSDKLIDDLLELAGAGQQPAHVESVDLDEVVDKVLSERAGPLVENNVEVSRGESLGNIRANPTHIYQIFSNLVDNAIRHNDSDNPRIEVSRLGAGGGENVFLVRDNGSGIDADDIDRIFTPFYTGTGSSSGLGLATVAKIAGFYSGEVRAYNDGGACFEIRLKDYGE